MRVINNGVREAQIEGVRIERRKMKRELERKGIMVAPDFVTRPVSETDLENYRNFKPCC